MKINIDGKEVELRVNGEVQESTVVKKKMADRGMSADEAVKKAKAKAESEKDS